MKTTRVKGSCCPHCKAVHTAASALQGKNTPSLGALSICIECAGLARFGPDLVLELIPEPELSLILADAKVQRMLAVVRILRLAPDREPK